MPITYRTLPVPALDDFTLRIEAGPVTFGVEYRQLDEASIQAHYGPDARARFDHVMPAGFAGTVEEDGLCLHVFGTADGLEYLRFDCFDEAAHYHLIDPAAPTNTVVEHDVAREGALLPWALEALRTRLPALLREAGATSLAALAARAALAEDVDPQSIARALERVRVESERMQAAGRPIRVGPRPAEATASPR